MIFHDDARLFGGGAAVVADAMRSSRWDSKSFDMGQPYHVLYCEKTSCSLMVPSLQARNFYQ